MSIFGEVGIVQKINDNVFKYNVALDIKEENEDFEPKLFKDCWIKLISQNK